MKKTKGKVLSLILASAMIVSSFSSMMGASAATARTETGTVDVTSDKLYLLSTDKLSDYVDIEDLIGHGEVETYDNEEADSEEVVRISHVKGDKLLRFKKDDDTVKVAVKANVSGKEVINVRYEAEYERDDKDVTVRASKDIEVYVDEAGELFLAKANASGVEDGKPKRPGELKSAAVNEQYLKIGVYYAAQQYPNATNDADKIKAKYEKADAEIMAEFENADNKQDNAKAKLKKTTVFTGIELDKVEGDDVNTLYLQTKFEKPDGEDDDAKLAKTGKTTLQIKLGNIKDRDSSYSDFNVEVAKKWNADLAETDGITTKDSNWEIGKRAGKTYIAEKGLIDWDDKDSWKDHKDDAYAVGSYDTIVTTGSITVVSGSVGDLEASDITVEDGNTGDLKAKTVNIEKGSVGLIKDEADNITIESGKVEEIDAEDANVEILGGTISGDIVVNTLRIDAEDDDVDTIINGKVTVKGEDDNNDSERDSVLTIEATSDAFVKVSGTIKASGHISLSGTNVVLGTLDADYDNDVEFTDFFGSIKSLINANQEVILENSKVALTSKLTADVVSIDEDSKMTVADARIGSIDGEGVFAFPAGKLFIEDGIEDDTILEITDGLAVGETAFQSFDDAVDAEDLTTRGFTLETKSANSSTDKHVIKAVKFAGVKFDKTELTIAKGYSDTLTVASYPTGTSLPEGATVEWNIDANDDYITMTVEGNVATIKAVDFNADRSIENEAIVTATVIDKDGFVIEDLMEASVKVSATALPASQVTLDTNKPITLGTGSVYQYIAKSSTGAVLSAASSDAQVATVELFNAADARGYKFQINALKEGKAVITTSDANGASKAIEVTVTKVNGSLKADTTSYTFAPGAIYDVKFTVTGSTEVPVVSVNGKVVSIAPRGNGVYRVTAQNPGTAYVVAKAGNTHVSVKFDVVAGATAKGVAGNNVSLFK